ncbi:MAG: hypothetical protein ACRDK2_13910 [Solirubrobacteraceae bacterium]
MDVTQPTHTWFPDASVDALAVGKAANTPSVGWVAAGVNEPKSFVWMFCRQPLALPHETSELICD